MTSKEVKRLLVPNWLKCKNCDLQDSCDILDAFTTGNNNTFFCGCFIDKKTRQNVFHEKLEASIPDDKNCDNCDENGSFRQFTPQSMCHNCFRKKRADNWQPKPNKPNTDKEGA